ncbi:transforming growth factor beta receptor type 3 isoform X2 [Lampris incognitus]|uniref:transforming growth factor beta receptor type 3 isoform X2 n=1 Tax=Lampris incognitus TaxID=2546036 RepID=UPI0024B4F131|nr:transforming growth factor beta receptor type 3 isoform X2 [Lampris incognitus]
MMASPSTSGWALFCLLLLWDRAAAGSEMEECSTSPTGELHPVQGLLEKFEVGPGCAARESGDKETHVIAIRRATQSPNNQVTVVLKPLSLSYPPNRALTLVLSSQLPINWWLQAEGLPPDLPVLIQVSSNSTVQSCTLPLQVQPLHRLPFRARALLRWTQKQHGSLSSLTHTRHGNRVNIRLGEDSALPTVCQLQSLFLSRNYLTSDLQPQEVKGCAPAMTGAEDMELHVIKLHSAGSGLCGSFQVEVVVSLVSPANSGTHNVVLILSSAVSVNWALTAPGLRGHISVHSSNSVSTPYPPEPYLTLSSQLNFDLSAKPDLLAWASKSGFRKVTSYTEASLANHFVIRLTGSRTEVVPTMHPLIMRPPWAEEQQIREWLSGRGKAEGGRWAFTVQCDDGRLSVIVDRHILQTLSVPLAAVTLRDPKCQAQSNGSHFLLVFPVILCGTEGLLLREPRRVQYKNMVLLWRDKPQTILAHNEMEKTWPLHIHFSCLVEVPRPPAEVPTPPQSGLVPGDPQHPEPAFIPVPRPRSGPLLLLKLFVTEGYEQRNTIPCVIIADHRVYVEVSAEGPVRGVVEVKSCVVSPLSDPQKSPFWNVITDGCSTEPSLTIAKTRGDGEEDKQVEVDENSEKEEEKEGWEEVGGNEEDGEDVSRGVPFRHGGRPRGRGTADSGEERGRNTRVERAERSIGEGAEGEVHSLRFSFILRPIYNNSMQFLHCSLLVCVSDSAGESGEGFGAKETMGKDCQSGLRIRPLVSETPGRQMVIRSCVDDCGNQTYLCT